MPNIASVLKEEILRLARKELRKEMESLKKVSAQNRSEISALKRNAADLERQLGRLAKAAAGGGPVPAPDASPKVRFSAKGLAKHRQRLGLSAQDAGFLVGVSAQTIYSWEAGKTRPRASQMEAIAALRDMGKRQVKARLAERGSAEAPAAEA